MALRLSTGLRNAMVARKGLPHAILTGITGAFVFNSTNPDSITDSANGLVTSGFQIGDWIKVFGATTPANNSIEAKLLSVVAGEMTFAEGQVDTEETFLAGTSVVAAKGGSLNDIFKHGVMHIFSGTQPASADDTENVSEGYIKRLMITDNDEVHVPASGLYGLEFEDDPTSGNLAKLAAQTWKGNGIASGDVGWFRFYDQAVTLGPTTTGIRFDGSVALSGAQLNVASTYVNLGVDFVINNFSLIVPGS